MSEELKKKLFNYEVAPPESVWTDILAALENQVSAEFPRRLYESEITPPSDVWQKIEPQLGADVRIEYPKKLYNLEVLPPKSAWQNISEALDQGQSLPSISQKGRVASILRYAVAAAVVGLVAFGVFKLLNEKSTDRGIATKTVVPQNTSPANVQPQSQQTVPPQPPAAPGNNLPKERTFLAKNLSSQKKKFSTGSYMTQTTDALNAVNAEPTDNFRQASLQGEVPGNCPLIADADRYLNFMDPEGSLIRVSKKLADAVGCFYRNGNSDEYKQCQEQIKRWRDRVTQSAPPPSADHFMDILDILRSVQDKEL